MITLQLDLHDVYLLCDLIDRARDDVEEHTFHCEDGPNVEGFASVVMCQKSSELLNLMSKIRRALPEPLEFCVAVQSHRLQSDVEYRKRQALEEASE